ncbi:MULTISPECIES: hypothetical protein [Saccharothrix]|uniref:hypothetical protein n=1 Tax=Saccharothrix TaxID=2071 RepID=UPI00116108DB|nr:hypothetical protein [Saccharothrix sp. CB00851]
MSQDLRSEYARPASAPHRRTTAQLIAGEAEIAALRRELVREARRECRRVSAHDGDTPVLDRDLGPLIGVRRRNICTKEAIEHEETGELIARAIADGEEYRLTREDPPTDLLIADDVALVCLDANGESGAVLVHAPHMVSMLADYFELLWAKAVPLGGEDDGTGPLPAVQRRILRLASQGFKDESIARILGVSSRSVRRNMEKLAVRAGASNRLTLGIAAAQLGWI